MDGRGHGAGTHPEGCRALGAVNNITWSLLDKRDPELGVRLTYRGGEPCRKRPAGWTDRDRDWVSVDRTFSIDMCGRSACVLCARVCATTYGCWRGNACVDPITDYLCCVSRASRHVPAPSGCATPPTAARRASSSP